jgi:hypothetical protein
MFSMFLTGPISAIAEILSEFASMLCLVMMYPRSFPRGILKVHFSVFNLMLNYQRLLKFCSKSEMRLQFFRDFIMISLT